MVMKTLIEYLCDNINIYESILDDEDVLIDDVKKSVDDIFTYILTSTNRNIHYKKFRDELNHKYIDSVIDNFPSLKKSGYKFEFNSAYNGDNRVVSLEVDIPLYSADKNTIFFIILDEDNSIRLAFSRHCDFGIKLRNRVNEKDYQKDIENFAKNYNFKKLNFYSFYKKY